MCLEEAEGIQSCCSARSLRELRKPAIVIVLVLAGFIAGVHCHDGLPSGLPHVDHARRAIRAWSTTSRWGLLVFFVGLFLIVGAPEKLPV